MSNDKETAKPRNGSKVILKSSLDILFKDGISNFSLRKVADNAGVRLHTVQYHFQSKDHLLFETINARLSEYTTRYHNIAHHPDWSAKKKISLIIDDTFGDELKPEIAAFFFDAFALGSKNPQIKQLLDTIYADYLNAIQTIIESIDSTPKHDSVNLAMVLTSLFEGMLVMMYYRASPPDANLLPTVKNSCFKILGI